GPAGPGDINGPGNQPFLRAPNPVDADIDARSTIYFTTWRGGGFAWSATAGRRGMVYAVRPRGYTPAPLPDYDALDAAALFGELQGPSYRRRIEAQRAIVRRNL